MLDRYGYCKLSENGQTERLHLISAQQDPQPAIKNSNNRQSDCYQSTVIYCYPQSRYIRSEATATAKITIHD